MVAELQLERLSPQREPHDLVPEADPEHRDIPEERADGCDGVRHPFGVPRPVRQEDAVGRVRQDLRRGGAGRHDGHVEPVGDHHPEDVLLDPEVDRDDPRDASEPAPEGGGRQVPLLEVPVPRAPMDRMVGSDLLHQVEPHEGRKLPRFTREAIRVEVDRRQDRHLGPSVPKTPCEGAGVDSRDSADVIPPKVGIEGLHVPPVRRWTPGLANDEPLDPGAVRFHVLRVDPRVADLRIRHRDDLSLVGRIREHFLVPGHAGVEDDLAGALPRISEGDPLEGRAVREDEKGLLVRHPQ